MKNHRLFGQYHTRLVKEKLITSLSYGIMIGAGVEFLMALAIWIFANHSVWIAIVVGCATAMITTLLIYFLKLRPTEKDIVRRMDQMGLEERTVTMFELRNDDSYMAVRQRKDTEECVRAVSKEQVRKAFPLFTIKKGAAALLAIALVCGICMTTVAALAADGTIPSPDILPVEDEKEKYINVTYLVEGGGEISGEPEQPVLLGGNASTVVAVEQDGWMFVRWSDGSKDPVRTDRNLTEDLTVTAVFTEIEENEDLDPEEGQGGESSDEGDYDKNLPTSNENMGSDIGADGEGQAGGEGSSDGSSGDSNGSGEGGQEGGGKGEGKGEGAGGGWSDGNQIIDGKTDYRDVFKIYYDMAMEILNKGGELPDFLREFIEQYYGSI